MSITPPTSPSEPTPRDPNAPETPLIPQPDAFKGIGQEYGSGKEGLPPAKLVGIILGIFVVVLAIVAYVYKAKSPATGTIDYVDIVDIADQNSVFVAITVTIKNPDKTFYKMHEISAQAEMATGTLEDEHPASAIDFDRYLQAFPDLKAHALPHLDVQTIQPGEQKSGTILVSFPVNAADFAKRKSVKVTITAFGETVPLVMTK